MPKFNITPTWQGLIPMLVHVAANGDSKEARDLAMGELMKLGEIVDRHIANLKTLEQEQQQRADPCPDCGGKRGVHCYGCPLGPQPVNGDDTSAVNNA